MIVKRIAVAGLFALIGISGVSFADDTELYVFENKDGGSRPKVLIIFDNSGSMSTIEEDEVAGYNPNYVQDDGSEGYPAVGSSHAYQGRMLYFTKGGIDNTSVPTPDSPSEARRFLDDINGCNQSQSSLDKYGRFTGYLREYEVKGKTGTWEEIPDNNGANIEIIDCWEDIEAEDPINADTIAKGFPVDALKKNGNAYPYNHVSSSSDSGWAGALSDAKGTAFGSGEPVTIYTDDYLRWYTLAQNGLLDKVPQSRLDIAKDAIKNVVSSALSVDFGLAVFNMNYPYEGYRDGGRIVSGIQNMTASAKVSLLSTIDMLPADTNTPLCETLFEAYRYFAGGAIKYGHKDSDYNWGHGDKYIANRPPYDTSIESGGSYISPMKVCPDTSYVVYITDGVPTVDTHANADIIALTSAAGVNPEGDYSAFSEKLSQPSYLAALASYMFNNDLVHVLDDNGEDQKQNVITFTIGFSEGADDAAPLLKETAMRGGGTPDKPHYYSAADGISLELALTDALSSILAIDSSFTSPSIASNNFDRTQTFDSAYYAMFLPGKGPRWSGNLKKLKVTSGGTLVDVTGSAAIGGNGNIKDTACTYWSDCSGSKDGNKVEQGGVAEMLRGLASRKLLSNTGNGGGLEALTVDKAANGDKAGFAIYMDTTEDELENTISWLRGVDVDNDDRDSSTTDIRDDIMGDPLHSKPLAINFGSESTPDVRVILGTNQGLLHMFKDSGTSVTESWGFIPYELLPNVSVLRENVASGGHSVYGMDLSPIAYVKTGSGGVEAAWVYAGMRRGGSSYYALDVTSPDSPSLMWTITPDSAGFSDLGQTWSEPVVTTIPGYNKPVVIFGGGYHISYDETPSPTPQGRSVYIVDAEFGTLLHTFGPAAGDGVTQLPGISDSIATSVAILDSDNDGATDRIYATDVGGNIWRMDMPEADKSSWTAFKFAAIGGSTAATDRRFFAEVVVAQTVFTNTSEASVTETAADGTETTTTTKTYQDIPYDAVSVGTGNRSNPLGKETTDMYYVFQDRNVTAQSFDGSTNTIPDTLTLNDLYNVTSKPPETEAENIAFGSKRGWYYDFTGSGEKSLTAGLIIGGNVYFTSYVPSSETLSDTVCTVSGEGRLYVFGLHKGIRTTSHLYYELGERVPDTPQVVIPEAASGEDPYIYIIGVGKGEKLPDGEYTGTINVGEGLGVNKIYYHIDE